MEERPLVSWLIPTTLFHHKWWKRLAEFLEEDFPAELIECIFLSTQDKDFVKRAKKIADKVANSLSFIPGIEKKYKMVRFIESYAEQFNIAKSRNILLKEAKGDVVIHRDADTGLIQYNFTRFMVKNLLWGRLGILGVPSIRNGFHFKPKNTLITRRDSRFGNILLAASVNGMATALLKSIELYVGGKNEGIGRWGEYTCLCTKLSRAGFALGYAEKKGYWVVTADNESSISLTDEKKNPAAKREKYITIGMINRFYRIKESDIFWRIQRERYGVKEEEMPKDVKEEIEKRFSLFKQQQQLEPEKEKYDFKPWECLSHSRTEEYLSLAKEIAEPFFDPVIKRIKSLGLARYFELPAH